MAVVYLYGLMVVRELCVQHLHRRLSHRGGCINLSSQDTHRHEKLSHHTCKGAQTAVSRRSKAAWKQRFAWLRYLVGLVILVPWQRSQDRL